MAGLQQDPFYIVRQEIHDTVNELHSKMSRFHGLTAANPERKTIASAVTDGCESLKWQVNELDSAVNRAAEQPQRFGLTPEEIASRRKWISATRRQIEGMMDTIKTATAARVNPAEEKLHKANEGFLQGEGGKQQLMMKQQDSQLEDIEAAVTRLGRVGLTIHEELASQGQMLDELEEDVDSTHSRLRATQKKVLDVIKKSGTTTQLGLIAFLMIVLVVIAVLAFV
ncbi:Qc-SNARE, Tlg1/Syntaxin 6-family [Scenedesmus sp. NREL 46B-D3]|nr:Qc-SNARE, Tlg1/Syntaxin 6-family [Scenedesmus sp. NREL 46B-D3]